MSWVCDFCSSSNDDSSVECFVCGQHRSEASIREARRRAKEEKERAMSEKIFKYSSRISQILFITSLSISAIMATLMLVLMAINGNLSMPVESGVLIVRHFGTRISGSFAINTAAIARHIANSSLLLLSQNAVSIRDFAFAGHSSILDHNITYVGTWILNSFTRLGNVLSGIFAVSVVNIQANISLIIAIVQNGVSQFANLGKQLSGLINKVIEKKDLFN